MPPGRFSYQLRAQGCRLDLCWIGPSPVHIWHICTKDKLPKGSSIMRHFMHQVKAEFTVAPCLAPSYRFFLPLLNTSHLMSNSATQLALNVPAKYVPESYWAEKPDCRNTYNYYLWVLELVQAKVDQLCAQWDSFYLCCFVLAQMGTS